MAAAVLANVDDRSAAPPAYRARGLVWPMLGALGASDPGSNPGGPI